MFGRNDPCWCRSDRKYKECHLDRDEKRLTTPGELDAALATISTDPRLCLHPAAPASCQGRIVKAHSIQRSGILTALCGPDNHLWTFKTADRGPDGLPNPLRIGINDASTFTGFCAFHDRATFAPIETRAFEGTKEQVILLGFRALCTEFYARIIQAEMNAITLHFGRNAERAVKEAMEGYAEGARQGRETTGRIKARFDKALTTGNLDEVAGFVVRFAGTQSISATGMMGPEYDFEGRLLQDMGKELASLMFALIKTDTGPGAVFTWLKPNPPSDALIRSMKGLAADQLPHAVVRFAFEHFENIYFSPAWWSGLRESDRNSLRRRALSGLPIEGRAPDCLRDDGLRLVDWTLTNTTDV